MKYFFTFADFIGFIFVVLRWMGKDGMRSLWQWKNRTQIYARLAEWNQ
jgi:hypothetical protein